MDLFSPTGVLLATAVTDANGNYLFSSGPGTTTASARYNVAGLTANTAGFTVRLDNAADYAPGGPLNGLLASPAFAGGGANAAIDSNGQTVSPADVRTTVNTGLPGTNDHTFDFGFEQPASVAGFVYVDANDNGVLDAGEAPIAGVVVKLTGTDDLGNAVSLMTTTAADGSYSFTNLRPSGAGGYTLMEVQPAAYAPGRNAVGTVGGVPDGSLAGPIVDMMTGVVLHPGDGGINYDFGELPPAGVSGTVFADYNDDGLQDGPDPGIPGVTITLTGTDNLGNAVLLTTTTDAAGNYSFTDLRPGTDAVTETQPGGYFDGKDVIGSAGGTNAVKNQLANIPLGIGAQGNGYNFGEVPMADPLGTVYLDLNGNGTQDPGEPGIPGVTVVLTGTDVFGNNVSRAAVTDAGGNYQFANLAPGVYTITEVRPAGYLDGQLQNGIPAAAQADAVGRRFVNLDLRSAPFLGAGYLFGHLLVGAGGGSDGFADAVDPVVGAPGQPLVEPTFVSKVQLLGGEDLSSAVAYVNGLYRQILGRAPDVGGLNVWVFQVLAGVPRARVAAAIWESPEHRGLQVDRMYLDFLHRPSDPFGRAFWVNAFLAGAGETDVAAALLSSPEYQAVHASDAAFVSGIYLDALGRAADAGGLAFWQQQLQSGAGRAAVAQALLRSPESSQKLLNVYYGLYLGRPADPVAQQVWLGGLESGLTSPVAEAILSSDEFARRVGA